MGGTPVRCALAAAVLAVAQAAAAASVTLDVGHTATEPGAISARGRPEFEFNRDLAAEIEASLRRSKIAVRVIGADGNGDAQPARRVKGESPDLLLSIHHDSVQERLLRTWQHDGVTRRYSDQFAGFSLFVSRENPQLDRSLACASAIGAKLRGAGFRPSLYHADPEFGERREFADQANGVHYWDNLAIVRRARVPAVLLEAGVIVNRDEEAELGKPETRRRIAEAVTAGVAECAGGAQGAGR